MAHPKFTIRAHIFLAIHRYALLINFGGRNVDFHVGCYPRTDGYFVVVFCPVAVMTRVCARARSGGGHDSRKAMA